MQIMCHHFPAQTGRDGRLSSAFNFSSILTFSQYKQIFHSKIWYNNLKAMFEQFEFFSGTGNHIK